MDLRKAQIGLFVESLLLLIMGLDTILFDFSSVQNNYPGDGYLQLNSSLFWDYWIDHCIHFDLNVYGKLIWGFSGVLGGYLVSELLNSYTLSTQKFKKIALILSNLVYACLMAVIYLGYEWRFSISSYYVEQSLKHSILAYLPYVLTFGIIGGRRLGFFKSGFIAGFSSVLLALMVAISFIHMVAFNLTICA